MQNITVPYCTAIKLFKISVLTQLHVHNSWTNFKEKKKKHIWDNF
jgi:hypothetical protein